MSGQITELIVKRRYSLWASCWPSLTNLRHKHFSRPADWEYKIPFLWIYTDHQAHTPLGQNPKCSTQIQRLVEALSWATSITVAQYKSRRNHRFLRLSTFGAPNRPDLSPTDPKNATREPVLHTNARIIRPESRFFDLWIIDRNSVIHWFLENENNWKSSEFVFVAINIRFRQVISTRSIV